jgi:hypothetical protein
VDAAQESSLTILQINTAHNAGTFLLFLNDVQLSRRLLGWQSLSFRECRQLAPSGGWGTSAIPSLSGDKQTSGEPVATGAVDPQAIFG